MPEELLEEPFISNDISSILTKVFTAATSTESVKYSYTLCQLILDTVGCNGLYQHGTLDEVKKAAADKTSGVRRESALNLLGALFETFPPRERVSEIIFLVQDRGSLVVCALEGLADKGSVVREAAEYGLDALFYNLSCEAKVVGLLPALLRYVSSSAARWQGVVGALKLVQKMGDTANLSVANPAVEDKDRSFLQAAMRETLAEVMPVLESRMHDLKAEVKSQACRTLHSLTNLLSGEDIGVKIPLLVVAMQLPSSKSLRNAISALSQTTFVAVVTAPVLALITPLLQRSLASPTTAQDTLRQTLTVVANVIKLVHNPVEARKFVQEMRPGVQRAATQAGLPDVRMTADLALAVMDNVISTATNVTRDTADDIGGIIDDEIKKICNDVMDPVSYAPMRQYVSEMVALDVNLRHFERITSVLSPYISCFLEKPRALAVAAAVQDVYVRQYEVGNNRPEEEEIVNANFSLGYGGHLLLSQTNLRILRGRKYGVIGRNGVGKSTLLKAIAESKVEGLPPPAILRTCLVDQVQPGSESSSVFLYVSADPDIIKEGDKPVSALLADFGFTIEDQKRPVSSLSGGNRMKLNLVKAIMKKPDILLLDEPTNHLDAANVDWLMRYLEGNTTSTCLIVSHDSRFLEAVTTDIYHFEPDKTLKHFTGSLAAVAEVLPEIRHYYTLNSTNVRFSFPAPTILTGVKSQTRAILRMTSVSYTYPGSSQSALKDISCHLSLTSRVSILGHNGAGKSTLVKLMTEEIVPTSGIVEGHPNLRIGYIKQDSLGHLEEHEDKSANQYIQWRYAYGDDREVFTQQSRLLSAADRAQLSQPVNIGDGMGPRHVEALVGRQKHLKSFKYEVYVAAHDRKSASDRNYFPHASFIR